MTLSQWAENGWLRTHKTSPKEIDNLLRIVDRDLLDAKGKYLPTPALESPITPP